MSTSLFVANPGKLPIVGRQNVLAEQNQELIDAPRFDELGVDAGVPAILLDIASPIWLWKLPPSGSTSPFTNAGISGTALRSTSVYLPFQVRAFRSAPTAFARRSTIVGYSRSTASLRLETKW